MRRASFLGAALAALVLAVVAVVGGTTDSKRPTMDLVQNAPGPCATEC